MSFETTTIKEETLEDVIENVSNINTVRIAKALAKKENMSLHGYSNDIANYPRTDDYKPPETSKFTVGDLVGDDGTWFLVYDATKKVDGTSWVLKFPAITKGAIERGKKRGLTMDQVIRNSVLRGHNQTYANITHTITEQADDDTPFLAEERLEESLRKRYARGQTFFNEESFLSHKRESFEEFEREKFYRFLKGLACAVKDMHVNVEVEKEGFIGKNKEKGVVHGDIHDGNIGLTFNHIIKLYDKGNMTVETTHHKHDRSGLGYLLCRPQEHFEQGADPTKRGDVYAIASVIRRDIGRDGKYFLQDKLDRFYDETIANPEERMMVQKEGFTDFMNGLSDEEFNELLKKDLKKNVHPRFRKFLYKNLNADAYKRAYDGQELEQDVDRLIKKLEGKIDLQRFWKTARIALISSACTALVTSAAIYTSRNNPAQEIMLPYDNPEIIVLGELPENTLRYTEEPVQLQQIPLNGMLPPEGSYLYVPLKQNFNTLMFGMGYLYAVGGPRPSATIDQEWIHYKNEHGLTGTELPYERLAKAVEYALTTSANGTGVADKEDVMAYVMLGRTRYRELRGVIDDRIRMMIGDSAHITPANNPQNYEVYKEFVDKEGERFFGKYERETIDKWRAYMRMPSKILVNTNPKDSALHAYNDSIVKTYYPAWAMPDSMYTCKKDVE